MKKDPLKSYTNLLDKLVKYITDGDKLTNFFKERKKTIFYFLLLLVIFVTSVSVWQRGECLNCEPLTQEEVIFYKQNPTELTKLADTKIFGTYTSVKEYLIDLILPVSVNVLGFLFIFSIFYILYRITRHLLKKYKVNPNMSINLDKFFRKDD